ncbi:hypothetical protein C8R47DRAFT_1236476 [Mycena vitilis]|nr:hypothetical protein C8R47DRAFT_1236476 [Mycena vitilis]
MRNEACAMAVIRILSKFTALELNGRRVNHISRALTSRATHVNLATSTDRSASAQPPGTRTNRNQTKGKKFSPSSDLESPDPSSNRDLLLISCFLEGFEESGFEESTRHQVFSVFQREPPSGLEYFIELGLHRTVRSSRFQILVQKNSLNPATGGCKQGDSAMPTARLMIERGPPAFNPRRKYTGNKWMYGLGAENSLGEQ